MAAVTAIRASVTGDVHGVGFRDATRRRALELGLRGWVRNGDGGAVCVHAEGAQESIDALIAFLQEGPRAARVADVAIEPAKVEGHEQFAIRGVNAGVFLVAEHAASTRHFDFRLEVEGAMRSWALPKGPSMDPAVKRLAVPVPDHDPARNDFEGPLGDGAVIVWDRGGYERGGRVPWPEALARGHAVFVLHGHKLRGGFALQRTGTGEGARWLLVKRRDEQARAGSDVVAERPESVLSGRRLEEVADRPDPQLPSG